jgi:decaprenylphospho-beta-D-erythro-pentofuranosid-2-ulose 2-reductase
VSVGVLLGQRMSRAGLRPDHRDELGGRLKVRRSNFVYGSTKAGLDGFYRNLGEALARSG